MLDNNDLEIRSKEHRSTFNHVYAMNELRWQTKYTSIYIPTYKFNIFQGGMHSKLMHF